MSLKKYLLIGAKYNDISSQLEKENRNIRRSSCGLQCFVKYRRSWYSTFKRWDVFQEEKSIEENSD